MRFLTAIFLLVSFTILAAPIPQDEINRVNEFIKKLMVESEVEDLRFWISEGEQNEAGKVTALTALIEGAEGLVQGELSIGLKDDYIELKAGLSAEGIILVGELQGEMFDSLIESANEIINNINAEGKYVAKLIKKVTDIGFKVDIVVKPISLQDENRAVKEMVLSVTGNFETSRIGMTVSGKLNANDELVLKAQKVLTIVFKSLAREILPTEEEMERFGEMIEELMEEIMRHFE